MLGAQKFVFKGLFETKKAENIPHELGTKQADVVIELLNESRVNYVKILSNSNRIIQLKSKNVFFAIVF